MKIALFAAAALIAGTTAIAQPPAPGHARVVTQTRTTTTVHRETGVRPVHIKRKVCRTTWRNHHRVRRCTWR
jgi:hypothetical protein